MENIINITINEEHRDLPKTITDYQFYSNFNCKIVRQNDVFVKYEVVATIERDYHMNSYKFFIVFNKVKNYYVLLNRKQYTILNVEDCESDYSIIEKQILNIVLKKLVGFIPYNFFEDDNHKALQKIQKYLNNRLYKLLKKYKNPFMEYSGCDNLNYYYDIYYDYQWIPEHIYEHMVFRKVNYLLENLKKKKFIYNGKVYSFNNPLNITDYYGNYYNYKVKITDLKILDIK